MWLRLTEIHSGDVMINFDQARFVERNVENGSRIIFGDDISPDSIDYLEVSQSLEDIEKMIKDYGALAITVEGPPVAFDPVGQATPTPGP